MNVEEMEFKEFEKMLQSKDLAEKLALLHKRRSVVNSNIYSIQEKLHEAKLRDEDPRATNNEKKQLQNFMSEQAKINDRVKEFSVLYRNTIDQIMLQLLKEVNNSLFENLLSQARIIYNNKNQISHHDKKQKHGS